MYQKKRALVLGDLHGYLKPFKTLLGEVNYNPKQDLLILLGDYIDRGPNSADMLSFIISLTKQGAIPIVGNHEHMLIYYLNSKISDYEYFQNGGDKTLQSYLNLGIMADNAMQRHLNFIGTMPKYYELDNYIFVHAGLNPDKSLEDQTLDELVWSRDFIKLPTKRNKIVVFGHTPVWYIDQDQNVWFDPVNKDKICIDTGAGQGKELSVLELPSGKVTSIHVKRNKIRRYNIN